MAKTLQEVLQIFGQLDDAGGSDSARERFRRYLRDEVFIPEVLLEYVAASESLAGLQRVRAMQDIINRIGELLGFQVTHGRYHGKNGPVTIDGHWRSNAGHQYLVEVRTGVDTPPDPARMRNFARLLHMAGKLPELHTIVCLYVTDKEEVEEGKIQETLIESPGKPDLRVSSVSSLIRLYELMRASKVSHDDVDRILFSGSVDIDSAVGEMELDSTREPAPAEPRPAEREKSEKPEQVGSGSSSDATAPDKAPAQAPVSPEMEEVARMVDEVSRPEKESSEGPGVAAASAAAPLQDEVTRKKEVRLTSLAPKQAVSADAAVAQEHQPRAAAASRPENMAPGFNATLNDAQRDSMPDLPENSWRDSLTSSDEQLFDSISGTRKKPFVSMGLGKRKADKAGRASEARTGAETAQDKSPDSIFSGIFSGLGRQSKPGKARGVSMDSFEQVTVEDLVKPDAGNRVDRTPDLKIPTLDETPPAENTAPAAKAPPAERKETAKKPEPPRKPEPPVKTEPVGRSGADHAAKAAIASAPEPSVAPPVFSGKSPVGETASTPAGNGQPASLEEHAALIRIVCRLWPYPEFRDYTVDVFTCGAKAHDLSRDDVEELLSLVELHSRRR